MEAGVHCLHLLLDDVFVDNAGGSGVVSLDRVRWLWPSYFKQVMTKRDHFLGGGEESAKFSLGCIGYD